ncbi:MAG TPA: cytochrome o ubiquinol oxidase subunit IV [Devosia sp.]|nr:cytochrome o ubiquinol oxidase subunit IV [Devosia sp.]
MSEHTHPQAQAPTVFHEAVHQPHEEGPHATLRGYLIGFVLSVILTALPFYYVMSGSLHDNLVTALVIMGLAGVQIIVHMVFFLHMSPKAEGGWSLMALAFTLIILGIALAGSLWVMYHMNANMMPMSMEDARQLP